MSIEQSVIVSKIWKFKSGLLLSALLCAVSTSSLAAEQTAPAVAPPTELFRNIFYTYSKDRFDEAAIKKLIFEPAPEFLTDPALRGAGEEALKNKASDWGVNKPLDLYNKGLTAPFTALEGLDEKLVENPVTIVVIPGIFGEFITTYPFHEVVKNKESSFAKQWATSIQAKPTTDAVFDIENLATSELDLNLITEVASVDNTQGQALVKIIYLKPLFGSLETLGTLTESSDLYLRRLNKIWNVLGSQENVYILGYSRGLNVALDLVSRAEVAPQDYPWYAKVKGVISLGGTLYGSALADGALTPGNTSSDAIKRLADLSAELKTLPPDASLGDRVAAVTANSAAWARAGVDLLAIAAGKKTNEGIKVENVDTDAPNLGAFGEIIKKVAFEKFKIARGSEYSNNVEKFKYIIGETLEGIKTLAMTNCLEWFRTHTIPAHLSYFVIQGTMGDPSSKETGPSLLAENSPSFNTKTLDYKLLRGSYYDYLDLNGTTINDSQVSPERTIYWPGLHSSLNPAQKPFQSNLIAVLGTDHWGMSFPVALESRGSEISPYPRDILFKSLGAFLSQYSAAK